jgi:hypothetical protein
MSELDCDGHDAADVWALLGTIRNTQALHLQDRDRVSWRTKPPKRPLSSSGQPRLTNGRASRRRAACYATAMPSPTRRDPVIGHH